MDPTTPGVAAPLPQFFCGTSPQELRRARRGEMRWNKTALTWAVADWLGGITQQSQLEAYAWAWQQWAEVTPLTFTLIEDIRAADIILNTRPIDGAGGTLAEMQLPNGSNRPIRGWFDVNEAWGQRIQLRLTALHEFGHACGLDHIDDPRMPSVLDSRYNPALTTLQRLDIQRVQAIYGKPPANKPAEPPKHPPAAAPRDNHQIVVTIVSPLGTFRGPLEKLI